MALARVALIKYSVPISQAVIITEILCSRSSGTLRRLRNRRGFVCALSLRNMVCGEGLIRPPVYGPTLQPVDKSHVVLRTQAYMSRLTC